MPQDFLQGADEGRYQQQLPGDVFALCKLFLADNVLSQPPLKVVPETLIGVACRGLDTGNIHAGCTLGANVSVLESLCQVVHVDNYEAVLQTHAACHVIW